MSLLREGDLPWRRWAPWCGMTAGPCRADRRHVPTVRCRPAFSTSSPARRPAQAAPGGTQLGGRRGASTDAEARLLTITARAALRDLGLGEAGDRRADKTAARKLISECCSQLHSTTGPRRRPSWLDKWRGEALVAGLLEGALEKVEPASGPAI